MYPSTSFRSRLLTVLCTAGLLLTFLPTASFAGKEPKKRVAVVDFENKAGRTQYQLGAALFKQAILG